MAVVSFLFLKEQLKDIIHSPHPWAVAHWPVTEVRVGVWNRVGGCWPSPPRGVCPSCIMPTQCLLRFSTGDHLCHSDTNAMAEEQKPLWLTELLLRVPEAFGCYISLHLARSLSDSV